MTALVAIEPFIWALAFDQPFGPYDRSLAEQVEMFTSRGGGWESCRAPEIFLIHQVQRVMPKTYRAVGGLRFPRAHVIAAGPSVEAMAELWDPFFAIGVQADDDTAFVAERPGAAGSPASVQEGPGRDP